MQVLIVVTHLLGAGHLTRAAALARAFAQAGHATTLVSGGRPARLVATEGVRVVQLPPVQTVGADFATLLDETGRPAGPDRLAARRDRLLATLDETQPDALVTELFPFGRRALAGEFLALLERARARRPHPVVLASVRDILAAPSKPARAAETAARLLAFYDAVLVHGDPSLIPLEASWPVDVGTRALLRYTGYVDDGAPTGAAGPAGSGEIVVSGGSSAAGLPLMWAALGAAAGMPRHRWRVLAGSGIADDLFSALAQSAPPNAVLERARPDFRALLSGAALSVSQAGYNTAVDLLRTRVRAVLVPFEDGRETEQRQRAECFGRRGLAGLLPQADLTAESLARHVSDALARPPPPALPVALDGAARSLAIVEALVAGRPGGLRNVSP